MHGFRQQLDPSFLSKRLVTSGLATIQALLHSRALGRLPILILAEVTWIFMPTLRQPRLIIGDFALTDSGLPIESPDAKERN
jgi:hypothetical protein